MSSSGTHEEPVDCIICAEPCRVLCVFGCGHFTCYSCGLRIHTLNKSGCPVCREKHNEKPLLTQTLSAEEEQYSPEELKQIRQLVVTDSFLNCHIDGQPLAAEIAKLYEYLCPMEGCWNHGQQEPFMQQQPLKDHLSVDHKLSYCEVCLKNRPAFLCEQFAYGSAAYSQHLEGRCVDDRNSFTGHPPCKFCKTQNRFYDGEALLKHMQEAHYTCDVCNRGQFTFTFYANRQKLDMHFTQCHKVCDHPDCANLDLMVRVFASDFDLAVHKQRVHGVKAKSTLTTDMFSQPAGSGPSGGSSGGSGSAPATASNTNMIEITFDHVFRREKVDMMPLRANTGGGGNSRNRGRGGKSGGKGKGGAGSEAERVHAPQESGLPSWYITPGSLNLLTRMVKNSTGVSSPTSTTPSTSAGAGEGKNGRRGGQQRRGGKKNGDGGATSLAFGIAEDMDNYNQNNKLPTDKKALDEQLNTMLQLYLPSPVAYANFKRYTTAFVNSSMMTSAYFDVLFRECFPDHDVFVQIFPLIVATVPRADKKAALQEVSKMRMAPEMLRVERAREEDARKEAVAAMRREDSQQKPGSPVAGHQDPHSRTAMLMNRGGFGGNKKQRGRGGNAWLTTDSRSRLTGEQVAASQTAPVEPAKKLEPKRAAGYASYAGVATSHTTTSSTTSVPVARPTPDPRTGNAWGSTTAAQSAGSPTAANCVGGVMINDENFPTLPNNGVRRGVGAKKQQGKPNAWFKK